MRTSRFFLATEKETPSDAEIISHQLMIRSGMMRRLAAGIYSWLPLGLRVLRKVETIVREEMDKAGAQEILMPGVQPAELWRQSGRWEKYGPELLRFTDRHQREYCLGPTHEEVVTDIVRTHIKSYRQLPLNLYQMQWKFRDEIRPRFGVMRGREFLMKDAYSFDSSPDGMRESYEIMRKAYHAIFNRLNLEASAVAADSGAIGGDYSHEFHVLADTGEDAIGICDKCGFAANVELLQTSIPDSDRAAAVDIMTTVDTPDVHTIDELCQHLDIKPESTVKTLIVRGDEGPVALVIRGDHELNAIKAEKLDGVSVPLEFASASEIKAATGAEPGSVGPVGLQLKIIADHMAAHASDFVCGANANHQHLTGVNWVRDLPEPVTADLRMVKAGESCAQKSAESDGADDVCRGSLTIRRGIEVGHIFQLGQQYSEALNASVLNTEGKPVPLYMGCYGVGVSRIVAAAIEQNHDDDGIIWPQALAPFDIAIVPIGLQKSQMVADAVQTIEAQLTQAGFDVLVEDRNERPGVMFSTMDLIGIPHRLVIGERGLKAGTLEYRARATGQQVDIPADALIETLKSFG